MWLCSHVCVVSRLCAGPGWGRAGGACGCGCMCAFPRGLAWSAECGRVYLISDVPSVFSADINCQTMSNAAQMFPGGGLLSFTSVVWVIKKSKGESCFGCCCSRAVLGAHGGLAGQLTQQGCPHTGSSCPSPSEPGAGHKQHGCQGARAVQSAGGESNWQVG